MATILDELITRLRFDYDPSALGRMERGLDRARRRLDSFATGAAALGTALTAAAAGAITAYAGVETNLAKIEGLVGVSREQLEAWKPALRDIGEETGVGPAKLTEALFFITSAGLRGAEALDVLRASAKAAAAGLGDQAVIADLLTSAVNAYGSDVLNAADATDALTEAIRLGKLEPATLAAAMGRILPVASAMGVSFQEVAGMLAAMSKTGTTAEEGGTQLTAVMAGLLKPSAGAEKALKRVGLSAEGVRASIAESGLFVTLRMLREAFGDNNQALAEVFPNIRALRGVFDLMGPQMQGNIDLLNEMADSTGVLDEAFGAAAGTLTFRWNQATAVFLARLVDMGERLRPFAELMFGAFEQIVAIYDSFSDDTKDLIAQGLALGPVLIGVAGAAKALAIALGLISLPALAVAAAAAAIYLAWDPLKQLFQDLGIAEGLSATMAAVSQFATWLSSAPWSEIGVEFVKAIADGIMSAATFPYDALVWVFEKARELLPFSDARRGPLSDLTASGQALMDTLAMGVRRAQPLSVPLAAALAMPDVPTLAANLDLPPLPPLPDLTQLVQLTPMLPALANLGPLTLDAIPQLANLGPLTLDAIPQLANLTAPLPVGPFPTPPNAGTADGLGGGQTISVTFSEGAIQISAPGADAEQIGQELATQFERQLRSAVEQADSQVRA